MRPLPVLVMLAALAAGCGSDGDGKSSAGSESDERKQGLSLSVSFDEPLRTGQPVTWTLEVENHGPEPATLVFRSGQDGDVSPLRDGREAYRWSSTRYFSQAMREERLEPGGRKKFPLEEKAFSAEAGDYELVAELESEPAPPPARRSVKVKSEG
jgi:uncharacterized protein (DUF58 family)